MNIPISKIIPYLVAALFLISGCAHTTLPADEIQLSLRPKKSLDKQEIARVEEVIKKITERNKTTEKSQEWLKEAYSSLKIKKLNKIPKEEHGNYKKFMSKNDTIYIVVHPAFYTFFQNTEILSSKRDAEVFPEENIVERFYKKLSFFNTRMEIFKEQERILRDFLEFMSTEKKLVILILPRDYKNHLSYGYINGLDEYARYINEVTNESESVIYVESTAWNQGSISDDDLRNLSSFLNEVGAKTIALGGGYVGKCLGASYIDIGTKFGFNNIYLVPEITAISPEDLNEPWIDGLLTKDGRLNIRVATLNLTRPNPYGTQQPLDPRVRNLPFSFYRGKTK